MEKNTERQKNQPTSKQIKIVVIGPESTGKTTLVKQLATHYKAVCVPEYSRIFAEEKKQKGKTLTSDDVLPIAKGQLALEEEVAYHPFVICDTDILATFTYAKIYYPEFNGEALQKYIEKHHADFYFLTYIDVPWEADGIRDLPQKREIAFSEFEQTLKTYNQPYALLKGGQKTRFQTATAIIDKLLQKS